MRLEEIKWTVNSPACVDESLTITRDSIGVPGGVITSELLVLKRSLHVYSDSSRLEVANFFAPKHTYRQLGMLIMASIFSSLRPELSVELIHERTELRRLRFGWDRDSLNNSVVGYVSQPFAFGYYPEAPSRRHPLYDERLYLRELPSVVITNDEEMCVTQDEYALRDVLSGFGSPEGAARFAELLLNVGLPDTTLDEFHLEGYPGFRSVSTVSAEIALWLPGSIGWKAALG